MHPFDSATKLLIDQDPLAWIHLAGLAGERAQVADPSHVMTTSNSDKLIHVYNPDYLVHIELQASYDPEMGRRMLAYNANAHRIYIQPVHSILFLLRPEADGRVMTGE